MVGLTCARFVYLCVMAIRKNRTRAILAVSTTKAKWFS